MSYWLLKTEPGSYSWDDLVREKKTTWNGVTNPVALKNIRSMSKGDLALIYHTGDERAAIGVAEIVSGPYADPKDRDGRLVVVDLKAQRKLPRAISLNELRTDKAFEGWVLLRNGRLSVVPVPASMWKRIHDLAAKTPVE